MIREAQMRILNQGMKASFRGQTAAYLRTEFPARAASLPPGDLDIFIAKAISGAEAFGLELEADICDYVAFAFEYGLEFPSWAKEMMDDVTLRPAERMSRLTGWAEALRRVGVK